MKDHFTQKLSGKISKKIFAVLLFVAINIVSFAQSPTIDFASAPSFTPNPSYTPWMQTATVTTGGVAYQIINGGNGGWTYKSTGGASGSANIEYSTAATSIIEIKRQDGAKFQFYGAWLKYTNYTSGYTAPWLTVQYLGSTDADQTYGANTTVTLSKNVKVSSVKFIISGLNTLNLDNIIVGPAAPDPATLTTNTINIFNQTSVTLGGNISDEGGAAVTEKGVVYNTTGTPTTADSKVSLSAGGTGSYSLDATGLTPNTTYYVRAYATNSAGTGYGSERSFTTAGPFTLVGTHNFNTTWASTSSQPTPFTKYVEGWDITAAATTGNVSITRITGTLPGEGLASVRVQSSTNPEAITYAAFKTNDGSAFKLNSFIFRYGVRTAGTSFGNINVTGYKNGVAVSGATATMTGIAAYVNTSSPYTTYTLSSIGAFSNVDEFRLTATNPSTNAVLSYFDIDVIDVSAAALPAPSVTVGSNPTICYGSTAANLPYSNAVNTPTTYSIVWNAAALSAGFANVTNQALPANNISLVVPANAAAATYSGTLTVSNSGGTSSGYAYSVTVNNNSTWTGSTNTSFGTGGNWNGCAPAPGMNVTIPAGPVVLTGTHNIGNLTVQSGASLTITGTLQITGSITNGGTINASGGTIEMKGTSQQTIPANVFENNAVKNLTIDNAGGVVLSGNLKISDVLTINSGNLNTNDNLVLRSTASGTARVAPVTGTITGNVTVERYIPARRSWRMLTAPLSNTNTIYQAWQNNGVYTPGVGILVTAPEAGSGMDANANYSLKQYNASTQQLEGVSNTTQTVSGAGTSAANKGYFVFVRGDRNPSNLTPPNTNLTTLSAVGKLQTGNQLFSASTVAGNQTLIGNPYASPVDFGQLTRGNIARKFWVWDPTLGTSGAYVLLDDMDGDGTFTITPSSAQTKEIQSGQAIFVQTIANGAASVTFTEGAKSTTDNGVVFRGQNMNANIKADVYAVKNGEEVIVDGFMAEFKDSYSQSVNIEDGNKMKNIGENFSLVRDGQLLSLERMPLTAASDTLYLHVSNAVIGASYRLSFTAANLPANTTEAWLEDKLTNERTAINVNGVTDIPVIFTQGTVADRYRVVFKSKPVSAPIVAEIKASQISVYPNPVQGKVINLQYKQLAAGSYTLSLYDMAGKKVYSEKVKLGGENAAFKLSLKQKLSAGIYSLQLTGNLVSEVVNVVVE